MVQNETSVSGDVVFQDGDELSETNLTRTAAKSNLTDYVERGLGLDVDSAAGTVDIGSGHAIIQDGINAYDLFPNEAIGVALPGSGTNYIYVAIQPGSDDAVYYHIDEDQSPPADPSILIGTVDSGAGTSTVLNRRPDQEIGDADIDRLVSALDANGQDISNVGAFDSDSVSTVNADVTGETFVASRRESDSGSNSTFTFVNVVDTGNKDAREEFSNFKLTPNETGEYFIYASVAFGGGTTDGDSVVFRLRDVNADTTPPGGSTTELVATANKPVTFTLSCELTGGETYAPRATNEDNSFKLLGESNNRLVMSRRIVHE